MGPVVEPGAEQEELVHLLTEYCRTKHIAHVELINDWFDVNIMQTQRFQVKNSLTYVCPLEGGVTAVWNGMAGTCRTRIRKAEKGGLTVEKANDPAVVEEFYSLFTRVLARKGLRPPYSLKNAQALFDHLSAADRLFALRIKLQEKVIATGFYPHDERAMYYLDGAYETEHLPLCPNNLMHWTAIKMAVERGIPNFNMGGGATPSRFTQKFGGRLRPYLTYSKSFLPLFKKAGQVYHFLKYNWYTVGRMLKRVPTQYESEGERSPTSH